MNANRLQTVQLPMPVTFLIPILMAVSPLTKASMSSSLTVPESLFVFPELVAQVLQFACTSRSTPVTPRPTARMLRTS